MKGRPITPAEVVAKKTENIPPEVFEVFNDLIAERWDGHRATIYQKDIVARLKAKLPEERRSQIFERHWLDVEPSYRKAGWTVVYDKPGYCETYEPNFTFTKGKHQ